MWLIKNEIFLQWMSRPSATLVCSGAPGVGKTVLASVTVDYLISNSTPEKNVLAVYCDRSDSSKYKYHHLLGSLLQQLVPEPCETWDRIKELYELHKHGTKPTPEDLLNVLRAEIKKKSTVYIVIDALDEWGDDHNDISNLVSDLKSLGSQVSFLIISRPLPVLESVLPKAVQFEIEPPHADVELYIRSRFSEQHTGFLKRDSELLERAISTVLSDCQGL